MTDSTPFRDGCVTKRRPLDDVESVTSHEDDGIGVERRCSQEQWRNRDCFLSSPISQVSAEARDRWSSLRSRSSIFEVLSWEPQEEETQSSRGTGSPPLIAPARDALAEGNLVDSGSSLPVFSPNIDIDVYHGDYTPIDYLVTSPIGLHAANFYFHFFEVAIRLRYVSWVKMFLASSRLVLIKKRRCRWLLLISIVFKICRCSIEI